MIQDGAVPHDFVAREVQSDERVLWWGRAAQAYPSYADYQMKTSRIIPVFVATRSDS
jgi:F420H(2)-dependent quinone reductase